MLDYLRENWVTIVLVAGFVWLHLRMHRGHGGHGRRGSAHHQERDGAGAGELPQGEGEPEDRPHHRV